MVKSEEEFYDFMSILEEAYFVNKFHWSERFDSVNSSPTLAYFDKIKI